MIKKREAYELVLFSDQDNVLCRGGSFETRADALRAVNKAVSQVPNHNVRWKVIKVTKEIVEEGNGAIPRPTTPARGGQGRWW